MGGTGGRGGIGIGGAFPPSVSIGANTLGIPAGGSIDFSSYALGT